MGLIVLGELPVDRPHQRRVPGRQSAWKPLILIGVAILSGCSRSQGPVPVTGTVTMDGAPLEAAAVRFHPQPGGKGNGGSALTDAAGRFAVISPQGRNGIFPGDYSITVSCLKLSAKAEQHSQEVRALGIAPVIIDREMRELLPKAYANPETSPLRVTVGAEGADVPVTIESSSTAAKPGR